ncbi:MAG TPA: hypothetical protein VEA99_10160 [Gemmatimonadaceae bacterium]|nr:hypothetical protein [Gemmatimonadaceae bacterium]
MLRITHVEEIAQLLLSAQALVQQQAERSYAFPESAVAWLARAEQVLASRGIFQAGTIAALRSEIIAAQHGQVPANVTFRGSPTRGKVRSAVAAHAVQRAVAVVSAIVEENQPRFRLAEERMLQLVAVALAGGLIPPDDESIGRTDYLLDVRRRLLGSGYGDAVLALDSLVGPNDMLVMLDRALSLRNVVPVEVPARPPGGQPSAGMQGSLASAAPA